MRRLRITLASWAVFFLVVGSVWPDAASAAGTGPWTLQESSGDVRLIRAGIAPVALTLGDRLTGGDWVETGSDGRALLTRSGSTILVAPNSRMGLPRDVAGPITTRILHTLGTILLTVERQARQHFEVKTPVLAAVVKGTTFTVSVQGDRALVHVAEGLVEVRNLDLGQATLVHPGETGHVVLNRPGVDVFGGDNQPVAPVPDDAIQTRREGSGGGAPQAQTATAAVGATPAVPANPRAKKAAKHVIRESLGTAPLDVKQSTRGLIRRAEKKTAGLEDLKPSIRKKQKTRPVGELEAAINLGKRGRVGATASFDSVAPAVPSAKGPKIKKPLHPNAAKNRPPHAGLVSKLEKKVKKNVKPKHLVK